MNLMEYVRIILRRGWIVVLLTVLTMGAAFLFSRAQTPVYRATQNILLEPSRIDFGLTSATTSLMRSYVVYLDSNDRAAEVIDTLQLDMSAPDLRSSVTIDDDQSRLLISVDVDLTDGNLAAAIARQYGDVFVEWRNERNQRTRFEDRINATLVDYPQYGQVRPNTVVNVIAGAVLGVLLGGVIVFILEYAASNIISTRDDITRSLELQVLGTIPPTERG